MLFAVCVVVAQLDRDYIRDKTLEGQRAAASRSNHGGRPQVIDDDTLVFARPPARHRCCSDPKLLAADMAAGYKHLLEVDVCRPATARKSASVNLGSAEAQALAPMDVLGT